MSILTHTDIPYAVKDGRRGYLWPIVTGCAHGIDVCPTRYTCWARTLARRNLPSMWEHYNRDFSPQYNLDLRAAPYHLKRPSLILVAFTGELFGPGMILDIPRSVQAVARALPQHTFVLLTKSPHQMVQLNPWPDNCWLGASITGAEPEIVQRDRYDVLLGVQGGHRWLSFEPTLGPLLLRKLSGLSWLVIGQQTGKRAVKPDPMWIIDAKAKADEASIPIYCKLDTSRALDLAPRMEWPWYREGVVKRREKAEFSTAFGLEEYDAEA